MLYSVADRTNSNIILLERLEVIVICGVIMSLKSQSTTPCEDNYKQQYAGKSGKFSQSRKKYVVVVAWVKLRFFVGYNSAGTIYFTSKLINECIFLFYFRCLI